MVERLPVVSSDIGTWGGILNGFLEVAHNADGTLKATAGRPTANTCGYMDWGPPTTFPDATFGYAGVSGYAYTDEDAYDTIKALGTIQRTLVYKNFLEVFDNAGAAGTNPEADTLSDPIASPLRHEFWNNNFGTDLYMKEAASVIIDSFGARILDLSNKDAQTSSILGARSTAQRLGLDSTNAALFADVTNDSVVGTGGIATNPDGVASDNDWENRYVIPFATQVFSALRAVGIPIVINGGGSVSGYHADGSFNRGDSRLRWMATMAPYVDGFSHEYSFTGSDDDPMDDSIGVTGAAANGYKSWWRYHLRIPALAGSLGKSYFGVVTGGAQNLRFARGSMLLVWNGMTEAAIMDFSGGGITDSSPSWRFATGYPTAGQRMTGLDTYTRSRQFELGTLVVNPDPTTAHDAGDAGTTSVPDRDAMFFTGEWF